MKQVELPAIICQIQCVECGSINDYFLFMASFYDFSTLKGLRTNNYYRVDEELIKYGVIDKSKAISPAVEVEGGIDNLVELPNNIYCNHCGKVTEGKERSQSDEININAVSLPIDN